MSKVYFINSDLGGCYYVRCLIPLINNGWNGDRTSLRNTNYPAPESRTAACKDADIVVFHRPDQEHKLQVAAMLKMLGRKIVFDNDDTYKKVDGMKFGGLLEKKSNFLDTFMADIADLVTCSTEYLAEEYRKVTNKPVVVLPNLVDPDDWDEPLRNETDVVRIGFTGSVALNKDFDNFRDVIQNLDAMPNVKLVLFSLPPVDWKNNPVVTKMYKDELGFWASLKNVEWHPFCFIEEYFDTLNELKLDMMLVPRHDDYFNRCKSNVKFLEASMLEIPVIAQGFSDGLSPYQVNKEDTEHMIICTKKEEWEPQIMKLINDKTLRRKIGKKAKEYVLKNYNAHDKSNLWNEAYEKYLLN